VALEHQPVEKWEALYFEEKDPIKLIEGGIALAHQGAKDLEGKIIDKLNPIKLEVLTTVQQIALLRSYALLFIRMGLPDALHRNMITKKLNAYFPNANNAVNKELGQLLLYLKSEGITKALVALLEKHTLEKTVTEGVQLLSEETTMRSEQYGPLIRDVIAKMPPSEAIYYGLLLSHADQGWTKDLRETYFRWFYDVLGAKGGMSFKAYMENVRQQAMTNVPEAEKSYFQELSGVYTPASAMADLPQPIGPGRNYTGEDMGNVIWGGSLGDYQGSFADGERAYQAAMCTLCHRMRGEGGAAGPDLTQAHSKFGSYDLMFAIYSPNDDISDQYANTLFEMKDGEKIAGRIKSEEGESITLMPNPFNESYTVQLAKSEVSKRGLSPISPMPPGLLNRLNEKEIKDLFVYLQAGGDPNDELYTKNKEIN
jgi:putative heme-binding domain-containing protein